LQRTKARDLFDGCAPRLGRARSLVRKTGFTAAASSGVLRAR
jgi:hypothetical protein